MYFVLFLFGKLLRYLDITDDDEGGQRKRVVIGVCAFTQKMFYNVQSRTCFGIGRPALDAIPVHNMTRALRREETKGIRLGREQGYALTHMCYDCAKFVCSMVIPGAYGCIAPPPDMRYRTYVSVKGVTVQSPHGNSGGE